jgi:hypothetical protein
MPRGVVGEIPDVDVVGSVRGWAFDLHLMGYAVAQCQVRSAERAAVAAVSLGASFEEALEFARVAFHEAPIPKVVTL